MYDLILTPDIQMSVCTINYPFFPVLLKSLSSPVEHFLGEFVLGNQTNEADQLC